LPGGGRGGRTAAAGDPRPLPRRRAQMFTSDGKFVKQLR
jgi:hypothetical protein